MAPLAILGIPMTHREKLYPLCEKLVQLALEIVDQSTLTVTPRGMTEPKIIALALLGRTLHNFKGVIVLTREKLAVEARVLARCCYENMFMVGGLHAEGAAFADRMIEDDRAGRKGRIRFTFENEGIFESLSAEMQDAVSKSKQSFDQAPRVQFLKPKDASDVSAFKDTYLIYSQFSGDAAHPTIAALARHWGPADAKTAYFDFIPDAKEDELDETLHLACMAVLGVMVVVNEMQGYTAAGKKLPALNDEFLALQAEKYGPASINEGMEIRTEPPKG
jgi:hypothetical protein